MAVDLLAVIMSSALVSTVVGSLAGFFTQRKLADRQAQLDYELTARRRLYEAVGPLQFQLLIAARDVVRRVSTHHLDDWNMQTDGYYVRSFVYRILRPLSILELVEQQMSYADFSVDPTGYQLLQFESAVYRMLVDSDPFPYHRGIDWSTQSQHVFRDNLRLAANRLIDTGDSGKGHVISYARFAEHYPDPALDETLAPLALLFGKCQKNLTEQPLWWARLVGYAYANRCLLTNQGSKLGKFADRPLDVRTALSATGEPQILAHIPEYPKLFDRVLEEGI